MAAIVDNQYSFACSSSAPFKLTTFKPLVQSHLKKIYDSLRPPTSNSDPEESSAHFLHVVQQEKDSDLQHAGASSADDATSTPVLTNLESFMDYMSTSTAIPQGEKKEDLSLPITNYFISSSHNTYLTGNQLYSEASTEVYKDVRINGFISIILSFASFLVLLCVHILLR
ncbi:hypothetical protein LOZ53_003337 [Ophidiomyces ophidiicola]|nr:hypothetical protein LOZ53_003337 [Ophidiomyces ophidiicola]